MAVVTSNSANKTSIFTYFKMGFFIHNSFVKYFKKYEAKHFISYTASKTVSLFSFSFKRIKDTGLLKEDEIRKRENFL